MASETEEATGEASVRRVVLVVEDEVLVRMLACDILDDAGYHPLEAVDAREALALLEARPDIALMFTDVDMPGEINGLGLARLAALRWPELPIVATSGAAGVQAIDLPPNGRFLQKPYSPSILIETVERALA
ncbi:response regulator [Caulobacter segnis]|uniref:response regulator n=1 Tax=Caulobacter segnis TaxID=88688 RepID=UPI00286415D7|nr:response regulator [Caulobacter segnis]MDR6624520.1 CheY-like chemotaxis protein [Caulobacter segnis]